jgi:hypothetical protein
MQVQPELVGNAEDYKPFSREFLERNPSAILKATMDIISCHTADAFSAVLSILCDKYGHDLNDVIETIKAHDTWKALQTHPLIKSLTYFNEDDVPDIRAGRDMSGNVWAGMPDAAIPPPVKRRKVGTKIKAADRDAQEAADAAVAKLATKLATTSIVGGGSGGDVTGEPVAPAQPPKKIVLKKKQEV